MPTPTFPRSSGAARMYEVPATVRYARLAESSSRSAHQRAPTSSATPALDEPLETLLVNSRENAWLDQR